MIKCTKLNQITALKKSGFDFLAEDVNVEDRYHNSPLYYAVGHQNLELIRWLLSIGANVNQRCEQGKTAYHRAFETQNQEVVSLLDNRSFSCCLMRGVISTSKMIKAKRLLHTAKVDYLNTSPSRMAYPIQRICQRITINYGSGSRQTQLLSMIREPNHS